jgi:TolB-like protein
VLGNLLDQQTGDEAIATGRRLLALDPLKEATHRALIRLYADAGDRSMAIKQYNACCEVLQAELGLQPDAATQQLAEEIQRGEAKNADSMSESISAETPRAVPEPPPLPDKPSIAVLPFVNMSADPEQEYFSDGITEDIITELARFSSLFVIARNSSFHYKGQSPKIQDVGSELGVEYVVEGSVRRAGDRVRITAQLIDAASGAHVWGERYDRDLKDIFAVQDEVVREIATAVPGQLDVAAINRVERRSDQDLTAYEYVLRGEHRRNQDWASPDAIPLFERAIEADPQCARAYAQIANWHAYSIQAHCVPAEKAGQVTRDLAEKALRIEPNDPVILGFLAEAYVMSGDLDLARRCIDKAIRINPNHYYVMIYAADVLAWLGDVDEALRWRDLYVRHDPLSSAALAEGDFEIFYLTKRYEDAIQALAGWQNLPTHLLAESAAAHAQAGRLEEAAALREQFESRLPPGYTIKDHASAISKMCASGAPRHVA